jgi:hypothetical protein
MYSKGRIDSIADDDSEFRRDGFRIHVEQRENGWGFRIKSVEYFMIFCWGGFKDKTEALEFADEFCEFVAAKLE